MHSVYQSVAGCNADTIFQLPDTFKAFVQTPLLTSYCASKSTTAQAIAPYNTKAIGQITCPNTAMFAFAGNFDGACVVSTSGVGSTVVHNQCYGPSSAGASLTMAGNANLQVNAGTLPSLSKTFSLASSTNCRNACLKIYPRCARPTGQPSMQPIMRPSGKKL